MKCQAEKDDAEQRCKRLMQSIASAAEVSIFYFPKFGLPQGGPGTKRTPSNVKFHLSYFFCHLFRRMKRRSQDCSRK